MRKEALILILLIIIFLVGQMIVYSLVVYIADRMEKRKRKEKLIKIEALYRRWFNDIDYTAIQFLSDVGQILEGGRK